MRSSMLHSQHASVRSAGPQTAARSLVMRNNSINNSSDVFHMLPDHSYKPSPKTYFSPSSMKNMTESFFQLRTSGVT
eukprot:2227595-Amphidinium_carterae.4